MNKVTGSHVWNGGDKAGGRKVSCSGSYGK